MKIILNEQDISKLVKETINKLLTEGLGVGSFPNNGYCLILAGGPGSGKSYLLNNKIPINGKIFDIDILKEKLKRLHKLHNTKLDNKNIPLILRKQEELFLKNQINVKNNIIFDICGRPEQRGKWSLIEEIISMVKPLGYKIGLIWVISNRSVALDRNINRERVLPDKYFHSRNNQVKNFLPKFLSSEKANNIDDAWVVFNSGKNLHTSDIPQTIHLEKNSTGFNLKNKEGFINNFLGPSEKSNNFTPQTYYSAKEIKNLDNKPETYVRHNINETIDESFSDKIYHFTTYENLLYIAKYNAFFLNHVGNNTNDIYLNRNNEYYLSFTREKSSEVGYPAYMNGKYNKLLFINRKISPSDSLFVRIEVDGNKLNKNFKGIPVNYHFKQNRNNLLQRVLPQEVMFQYRQNEDRLISNKDKLENANNYITCIDIYIPLTYIGNKQSGFKQIIYLLRNSIFKNKINIYTNKQDFDLKNNNIKNDLIIPFLQNKEYNLDNSKKLSKTLINDISIILFSILYSDVNNEYNVGEMLDDILKEYKQTFGATKSNRIKKMILFRIKQNFKHGVNKERISLNHFTYNLSGEFKPIYNKIRSLLAKACMKHNVKSPEALIKIGDILHNKVKKE